MSALGGGSGGRFAPPAPYYLPENVVLGEFCPKSFAAALTTIKYSILELRTIEICISCCLFLNEYTLCAVFIGVSNESLDIKLFSLGKRTGSRFGGNYLIISQDPDPGDKH